MEENLKNNSENNQPPQEPPGDLTPEQTFQESQSDQDADQTEQVSPPTQEISQDAKTMAMLCHLLGLVGFLGPLIIWVNEKDKDKYVDQHGRVALNYQISMIIFFAVCWLLCVVVIGFFLMLALIILHIIFVITAANKAIQGEPYRYPIAIPFIR